MTHIRFFEKPGCAGNAKQKKLLEEAGHSLEVRNLLTHPWDSSSLGAFLDGLPVADWFNRAAPRVKSGEVVPEALEGQQAMALLLAEPLLIRRPLLELESGERFVGFEVERLGFLLGPAAPKGKSLEGCASRSEPCAPPKPV